MTENPIEEVDYNKLSGILDTHMISKYWLIILIGALGGFLVGYDAGIIGSALLYLPFKMTTLDTALAVAGTAAFSAIGAITAGPLIDKFGRKSLLIIDGIVFAIFAVLGGLATNILIFVVSRVLIGYAIGTDFAVAPVYISEIAPTSLRGRLNMLQQIMIFVSGVVAFGAGYALSGLPSSINWRWMIGVGAIPAVLLAAFRVYLPESPRWLATKGYTERLTKSLNKLGIQLKGNFRWAPLKETAFSLNKRALLIVGIWVVFEIGSGINVLLYYGPTVYASLGFTGPKAILSTLILDALAAFGFVAAFFIIDKTVKKLSIVGFVGMFVGMVLLAAGSHFIAIISGVALVFSGMLIFYFTFQMAMGNSEMVLIGTALPRSSRGIGGGVFAAIAWTTSFAITFVFPYWDAAYGFTSFAILEGVIAFCGLLWTIFMLPEVAKVPIEQINAIYETKERI